MIIRLLRCAQSQLNSLRSFGVLFSTASFAALSPNQTRFARLALGSERLTKDNFLVFKEKGSKMLSPLLIPHTGYFTCLHFSLSHINQCYIKFTVLTFTVLSPYYDNYSNCIQRFQQNCNL